MKIGVFTVLWADQPLETVLDRVAEYGLQAVELATSPYSNQKHCPLAELLADEGRRRALLRAVEERGLIISGLSAHGNPLHPDPQIAQAAREVHRQTVRLAEQLGVEVVNNFSGCPGGGPHDRTPNWITAPWPPEFARALAWQWEEVALPYWREEARFAAAHGVKIALEMHPNFLVYNPETLLRLREACGENLGANFDPSHLFWQGIDPVAAIQVLGEAGAIYHFHAKDCRIHPWVARVHGVLDTKNYTDEIHRGWVFRTVGYGHEAAVWKDIVSMLRLVGYDHVLSIEHEDSLMSGDEGFRKAVAFLREVVIAEPRGEAYWA
jgi:sugar phosphate isomerase/epimerase